MSRLTRFTNLLHTAELDHELEDEQLFHIESRTCDLIHLGISPAEAAERARRQFGNRLALRESSREAKCTAWLESLAQDARFALLLFRKNLAVTITIIVSMALCAGAATASFALVDALLLRPFPVPDAGRMFYLTYDGPGAGGDWKTPANIDFSYPMLRRFADAAREHADLFGVTYGGPFHQAQFDGSADEEPLRTQWISTNGFQVLQLQPLAGRLFNPDDEQAGGERPAVISHAYWMRRFGGSKDVIGQRLSLLLRDLDAGRFRIVGVAPRGFSGLEPGAPADMWFPLAARVGDRHQSRAEFTWFQIRGRWHEHSDPDTLRSRLQSVFTEMRGEIADRLKPVPPDMKQYRDAQLQLRSASDTPSLLRAQFGRPLLVLLGIALLLLIIAGANVANLSAALSSVREQEMAMRRAIGAGTLRLLRQLAVESVLLSATAWILGTVMAAICAPAIVRLLAPSDFPAYLDLAPNARTLLLVAFASMVTTLLFNFVPAVRSCGIWMLPRRPNGGGRPVLLLQATISFIVLFLSGLLLTSFYRLTTVARGFSGDGVFLFTMVPRQPDSERQQALELLHRIRSLPFVQAAALSSSPMASGIRCVQLPIRGLRTGVSAKAGYMAVSPEFFSTMQVPITSGRDFTGDDTTAVIVNEAFARTYFPAGDALGQGFERIDRAGPLQQRIVGVVADARFSTLRESGSPVVFIPVLRIPGATLQVRLRPSMDMSGKDLERHLGAANPAVRFLGAMPHSTRVGNALLRERLMAWLAAFFAATSMLLAFAGLFGVLNYAVRREAKNIAIRGAMGARPVQVIHHLMGGIFVTVLAGAVLAIGIGLVLAPLLRDFLFDVNPASVYSLLPPFAALLVACLLAAFLPAVRAIRISPALALRAD